MEHHAVQALGDFSVSQWSRIATSIRRQCQITSGQNCQIAIGIKETDGQLRRGCPVARIYLPHKRARVPLGQRLPGQVEVRLRTASGGFRRVSLGTDVDHLSRFEVNALRGNTRQSLTLGGRHPDESALQVRGERVARADGIVQWLDKSGHPQWGVMTVAHLFDQADQRAFSVRLTSQLRVHCQRLIKGSKRSGYDVAILWIKQPSSMILERLERWTCETNSKQGDLAFSKCPVLPEPPSTAAVIQAIDDRVSGRTHGTRPAEPFTPTEFFPNGMFVDGRKLLHCVKAQGHRLDVFPPGTSGALWTIGGHWACMQSASRRPDYQVGIGQPLSELLRWLRSRGSDARGHRWSTLQLVAVRTAHESSRRL